MQKKVRGRPREFDFAVRVRVPHEEKIWLALMAAGLGVSESDVVRFVLGEYRTGGCCHLWCKHEAADEAGLLGIGDELKAAMS